MCLDFWVFFVRIALRSVAPGLLPKYLPAQAGLSLPRPSRYSSVAEHYFRKVGTWVRFPLSAPIKDVI